MNARDAQVLDSIVGRVHHLARAIRFWDAPDFPEAWIVLMRKRVDFINTDHIAQLAAFLKKNAAAAQ